MDDAQRRRESNSKKKTLEEALRYWIPQLQEKNLEWLENEKSAGLNTEESTYVILLTFQNFEKFSCVTIIKR